MTYLKKNRMFFKPFYLWIVLASVALCACAIPPKAPTTDTGRCDPTIDQAVKSGDWSEALRAHQQWLTQFPSDCRAMYHLGYIWGQLGDRHQEVLYYEKALSCGYTHDDQLYFNMGMAKANRGDFDGALSAFKQAIGVNPKNADNFFGMGLICQAMGRKDEAEHAWLQAVALDPRHIEGHLALARLFLDQSRWDAARHHLNVIQGLAPDNEEARRLREVLRSRQALEY